MVDSFAITIPSLAIEQTPNPKTKFQINLLNMITNLEVCLAN
jgi:hypothetical protein